MLAVELLGTRAIKAFQYRLSDRVGTSFSGNKPIRLDRDVGGDFRQKYY